jgi:hypothetical protein
MVPGALCTTMVCTQLQWEYTCGLRICDPSADAGRPPVTYPPCTNNQKQGADCPTLGQTCDPGDPCQRMLACQTGPSICPL